MCRKTLDRYGEESYSHCSKGQSPADIVETSFTPQCVLKSTLRWIAARVARSRCHLEPFGDGCTGSSGQGDPNKSGLLQLV